MAGNMFDGIPIMTGQVKEVDKDKDKLNKVTVTVPILDNMDLEARIGYPIAGEKYGFVWTPSVGQEVLLAFPYGEINQPVIVCSMYNDQNKPPQEITKDNQYDIYYKSKFGNEFTIHDEDNKSKIEITTQKGHKLIYDDDKETLTIKAKADNSEEFDLKNGEITIQVKKKIFIKAGQSDNLTVADGKGVLANSTQGKLSADCKNVELTGNAGVKVDSKASLALKGSTFQLEGQATGNVKAGILNLN